MAVPHRDQNLKSDTGIGMDKAMVELILSGRAVSTACTNGELGYGLGLALVKKLVEDNHGFLSLSSEKNTGTTFKVVIPLKQ